MKDPRHLQDVPTKGIDEREAYLKKNEISNEQYEKTSKCKEK